MFRPMNLNPGFWNTFFSINIMFFANLFVPRLGEVTRCGVLAKYEEVPVDKSIGTMVVERMIDALCLLILIGILFLAEYETISNYFFDIFSKKTTQEDVGFHWTLKYGLPTVLILALIIIAVTIARKHGIAHLKKTVKERILGVLQGFTSIRYMKDFKQFIVLTVMMWLCYFLMVYLSFFSLTETENLGAFTALACLIFGSFAMVATPGGIGAYPLAIRAVLLLYGINEVIGGALGTMIWGIQTIGVFLGGIISLILLAIINPSKNKTAAQNEVRLSQ